MAAKVYLDGAISMPRWGHRHRVRFARCLATSTLPTRPSCMSPAAAVVPGSPDSEVAAPLWPFRPASHTKVVRFQGPEEPGDRAGVRRAPGQCRLLPILDVRADDGRARPAAGQLPWPVLAANLIASPTGRHYRAVPTAPAAAGGQLSGILPICVRSSAAWIARLMTCQTADGFTASMHRP